MKILNDVTRTVFVIFLMLDYILYYVENYISYRLPNKKSSCRFTVVIILLFDDTHNIRFAVN